MPLLPFAEWRPDLNDTNREFTSDVLNVVPQADGYGPMRGANAFTGVLPDDCRGVFHARNDDGSIRIFAATDDRLYSLDNTSLLWTDVSKGGSAYTPVPAGGNWTFVQFNTYVIACQANTAPQAFQLGVSSAFADLGGSPPSAAYVSVVNRFVVLTGIAATPRRIHWSGLNDITEWTSGTNYSDYQDLPDGGNTTRVIGGEFGIIFQDSAIRRMVYSPGSDIIFQIDRIAKDIGDVAPSGVIDADGRLFFLSAKGFCSLSGDGAISFIGRERVDRFFASDYDSSTVNLIQGAADPSSHRVFWTYKRLADNVTYWTRMLAYDYQVDRWAPIEMSGDYLATLARPGLTLDSLDTIGSIAITGAADNGSGLVRLTVASTTGWTTGDYKTVASVGGTTEANGLWAITVVDGTHIDLQGSTFANAYTSGGYVAGSIDALDIPSLDDIQAATLAQMAVVTTGHQVAYLTGDALEATLTTAAQSATAKRMFVRGFYPITDAETVYGSTACAESYYATPTVTTEQAVTAQGFIPQRASTRIARGKIRIPAATAWSYASGVDPDVTAEGRR